MATWVEDIVQALKNLGGQAHRKQILEEVKRIRTEPLPNRLEQVIQRTIQNYSSDSAGFKGKDLFKKVGNGVWALREQGMQETASPKSPSLPNNVETSEGKTTWVEDIIQALKNLGGKSTLNQIYEEVSKIRQGPLPKMWQHIIQDRIYQHSSDTQKFQGNDLFRKVDKGVWALRGQAVTAKVTAPVNKGSEPIPQNYLPAESFEEIANILRTIKQYRDYQHPDSSSWKEYVDEVFHILGFSTDVKNPRLMTLNVMGSNHTPKAIVAIVHTGENFEELVSGLSWESYLFFAANFYHINWGILTDGLKLKILHYPDQETKHPTFWPDFDGIILHEKLDTFCSIYKIFSFIKGDSSIQVVKPEKKGKLLHGQNGEILAERPALRRKFWKELLEKAKVKTKLHAKVTPGNENWTSAGAGKTGLYYSYVVRMDDAQVELYIDRGEVGWNKSAFDSLFKNKIEIERTFGESLDWQRLNGKRASRIRYVMKENGLKDQSNWEELQDRLIEAMIRLDKAINPYFRQLS